MLIENQHPSVLVYMRGITQKELELLLEFTYSGEVEVEPAELKSLLRIGKELGLQGLQDNVISYQDQGLLENTLLSVMEDSSIGEDTSEKELNNERILISDLRPGFDEMGPPMNIKPEHLALPYSPNNGEEGQRSTEITQQGTCNYRF